MPSRGKLPTAKMSGLGEHAPAKVPGDDAGRHVDSGMVHQGSDLPEEAAAEAAIQEAAVGEVQPVQDHKGGDGQTLGHGCPTWCCYPEQRP